MNDVQIYFNLSEIKIKKCEEVEFGRFGLVV